jgi:uncharacterized protein YaiI (UPF0178 family)
MIAFLNDEVVMTIWIDADACPVPVREMVLRASMRTQTPLVFVANSPLPVKRTQLVKTVQVSQGFDVADNYISQNVQLHDLVVTQDIPLAAELVEKGIIALNPRGELYTADNVKQRLAMRNIAEELRSIGQTSGGPNKFSDKDKQQFANALDKWLQKAKR